MHEGLTGRSIFETGWLLGWDFLNYSWIAHKIAAEWQGNIVGSKIPFYALLT